MAMSVARNFDPTTSKSFNLNVKNISMLLFYYKKKFDFIYFVNLPFFIFIKTFLLFSLKITHSNFRAFSFHL